MRHLRIPGLFAARGMAGRSPASAATVNRRDKPAGKARRRSVMSRLEIRSG